MDWRINVLFLAIGAVLTWVTPITLRDRWARVVAVCIGRYLRLSPTAGAPRSERLAVLGRKSIYGAIGKILYPRMLVTSGLDAAIALQMNEFARDAHSRRHSWQVRFGRTMFDEGPTDRARDG